MKKLITAFALVTVMLAGCSTTDTPAPEEPITETETITLDAPSFSTELGKTEDEKVRVYLANKEELSSTLVDGNIKFFAEMESLTGLKEELTTLIGGLTLTEDADQNKVYGDPVFFVDLNKVFDSNYARFVVFENMITISSKESHKNYTLDDASKEAINSLYDKIVAALPAE